MKKNVLSAMMGAAFLTAVPLAHAADRTVKVCELKITNGGWAGLQNSFSCSYNR